MKTRREQDIPLRERVAAWAKETRQQADQMPPGPERDELLKKVRQAETFAHLEDWLNSPGLQPPK
jgi:hypothetical protein